MCYHLPISSTFENCLGLGKQNLVYYIYYSASILLVTKQMDVTEAEMREACEKQMQLCSFLLKLVLG